VSPRVLKTAGVINWGMRKVQLTVGAILVFLAIGACSCSNHPACANDGGVNYTSVNPQTGQTTYYCNDGSEETF
jgi:hypothetical protein